MNSGRNGYRIPAGVQAMPQPVYKRILLKLSGESFLGDVTTRHRLRTGPWPSPARSRRSTSSASTSPS
ncbi:MAG: hypothetical protein MZV63_64760 [Marinilabiliales bacterium]|nr:hypothetical protein [Marinilabiliales bacterium]